MMVGWFGTREPVANYVTGPSLKENSSRHECVALRSSGVAGGPSGLPDAISLLLVDAEDRQFRL